MRGIIKEHIGFGWQIWTLSLLELKAMCKGSILGFAWLALKPLITLLMFWFTMLAGIRASSMIAGFPRFDFMLAGFIAWFFMRDMIIGGAKCIRKNSQYVTKISFPISVVFTFTAISKFIVHMGLVILMYIYLILAGYRPSVYHIQFFLYAALMFLFFLACSWTLGSWSVFSRDFQNFVSSIVTGVFWVSGVLWDSRNVDNRWLHYFVMLNPVNFFVNGYRKTFLYQEWFWRDGKELLIFFAEFLIVLCIGAYNYKKTRKDMADVL
ncbi:MAG: ABC transporter permease [Syntrophomonadaceae bacterium]|nr:ABC transporter permease [Syntrophomonadaceae bacterium]